jgi:uDENN domain
VVQILYTYPAGKAVTPDVANFCFPHGVQPVLLERTPSMSALNEVVYSQQYRSSDGQSFIFLMKVRMSACPVEREVRVQDTGA